jgi:amidase
VLLKDNVDTADRMQTTAGSLALVGAPAPREDARVAARLREAGAVLLGKTNLSEWANFRSTRSSSGWSARGGQTRNPYALDRTPCGSSSGSGAAVAANLAALAVGTETDGSIVCPAATCGIVGVKPTLGLVSRSGIIPIAHSQDTAGPMARTVRDAALLLAALAAGGPDADDAATAAAQPAAAGLVGADLARALDAGALRGARIGVARNYFGRHEGVHRVMDEALAALRDAGAVLVDPAPVTTAGRIGAHEIEVLLHEFKADLDAYLATRLGTGGTAARNALGEPTPRSLAELIAFNQRHAAREMPFFGQELFERAQAKGPLTTPAYLAALADARRLAGAEGIDATLAAAQLDALVAPSNGPAWTIDVVTGDHGGGGSSTAAAVAGYPNVTVPAGAVHGLPIGLSFIGPRFADLRLLGYAHAFEQATHRRRAPDLRAAVPV